MELRRFLIILTIAVVVALTVAVWFIPSEEDFRVENPSWNGLQDISGNYSALPLQSLSDLPPLSIGSTLILIPYLDLTAAELEQLDSFITQGGRLVLADDYGYGNQILEYLGFEERFTGETLLDPMVNYKNQQFPKIFRLEPSPLTNNVTSLVLNHATCLSHVSTNNTLAMSSSFSFLDLNNSGNREEPEPKGPLPVISHRQLGNGEVILVSDPSLFINSMETIEGNATFIKNITSTAANLYIDQSHLPATELHLTKDLLTNARHSLSTPPVTVGLVVLVLAAALRPVWQKKNRNT